MTGTTLEIYEELGRGSQGLVLRGRLVHPSGPRREVAIKRLMPADDIRFAATAVARLHDEAAAVAALSHPSIPDFIDLVVVDNSLALITRYVDGHDLDVLLDDGLVLPPRACAELLAAAADALDGAWSAPGLDGLPLELVHRDLKPSNLRLDRRGHLWLLDFGLARSVRIPRRAATLGGGAVGTPAYMAPERLRGSSAGPPADVFALGLIGLEVLGAPVALPEGWTPSSGEHIATPQAWASRLEARAAETQAAEPDLIALLFRMAAWDAQARPTADEVCAQMRALAPELPGDDLVTWTSSLVRARTAATERAPRIVVPSPVSVSDARGGSRGAMETWTASVPWVEPEASGGAVSHTVLPLAVAPDAANASPLSGAPDSASASQPWARSQRPVVRAAALALVVALVAPMVAWRVTGQRATPPVSEAWPELSPSAETAKAASPSGEPTPEVVLQAEPAVAVPAPEPARELAAPLPAATPGGFISPSPSRGAPAGSPSRAGPAQPSSAAVGSVAAEQRGDGLSEAVVVPAAEPSLASWRAVPPAKARLRRGDVVAGPGRVAPGVWQAEADFGGGYVFAGEILVPASGEVVIRCMPWQRLCEVAP